MFENNSRYAKIPTTQLIVSDERKITYVRRRFLPQAGALALLAEVTVTEGDRLDLIAARTLGDPESFWQVCDANDTINPDELIRETGRILRISMPQFR